VSGVKEAFADAAAMRRHRRTAPTTVPAQTKKKKKKMFIRKYEARETHKKEPV
jgi:hypothetical protein